MSSIVGTWNEIWGADWPHEFVFGLLVLLIYSAMPGSVAAALEKMKATSWRVPDPLRLLLLVCGPALWRTTRFN